MAAPLLTPDRSLGQRCGLGPDERRVTARQAERLAKDLQLLADPVRLRILDLLASRPGEVCVCDLEASLPVRQPTISHHLRVLLKAGLVTVQRRGLWAYYRVDPEGLDARRGRLQAYLDLFPARRSTARA